MLEKERVAEKVAEEDEAKRAAKKKLEDERVAKLSAAEQQKVIIWLLPSSFRILTIFQILEKERKRAMRKAQMRSVRK